MSKFSDRLLAEMLFRKEPKERVKKVSKEMTLKDFVKMQKELEEYQEWRKSKEKKDEKKDEPKSWWKKLSVWQQLSILMVTVPLALMMEVTLLLKFAVVIGTIVKP